MCLLLDDRWARAALALVGLFVACATKEVPKLDAILEHAVNSLAAFKCLDCLEQWLFVCGVEGRCLLCMIYVFRSMMQLRN